MLPYSHVMGTISPAAPRRFRNNMRFLEIPFLIPEFQIGFWLWTADHGRHFTCPALKIKNEPDHAFIFLHTFGAEFYKVICN